MTHVFLSYLGLELAYVDQVGDLAGPHVVGLDGHLDLLSKEMGEPLFESLLTELWEQKIGISFPKALFHFFQKLHCGRREESRPGLIRLL